MDLFWILFFLIAMQPALRKQMLDASRRKWIARMENERKSRVILLVHRQETMSLLGFPLLRFLDVNDSEEVLRAVHLTDPNVPLDIVLHTPGGLVLAAMQIARAIKAHPAKVTVFVPHHAMSGGTLIALAADEIVMAPHAVLGPVDPQLGELPAASLVRAVEKKPVAEVDDRTLVLADQARMALQQVEAGVRELLAGRYPEAEAARLAKILSQGTWTHDHGIHPDEAKALGLEVSTDLPETVQQLMSLFPQPVRHVPSVEYLPGRRSSGRRAGHV